MLLNYEESRDFTETDVRNTGSLLHRPIWTRVWIKRFIARERKKNRRNYLLTINVSLLISAYEKSPVDFLK